MGKGTIISHNGESKYTVEVEYDTSYAERKIEFLNDVIPNMESQLTNNEALISEEQVKVDLALSLFNSAIASGGVSPVTGSDAYNAIRDKTEQVLIAKERLAKLEFKVAKLKATLVAYNKELKNLTDNLVTTEIKTLTPIDYCDGGTSPDGAANGALLSGEVGLLHVANDPNTSMKIAAGYTNGGVYDQSKHGKIVLNELQSDEEYMYNHTMQHPVQRWKPIYRSGTVLSRDVSANTMVIEMDSIDSDIGDISFPKTMETSVQYMSCNVVAFEVGDKVVVQITIGTEGNENSYTGVTVGFKDNPKQCPKIRAFFCMYNNTYYRVERDINGDWQTYTGDIGGLYRWENTDTGELFSWAPNESHYYTSTDPRSPSVNYLYRGRTRYTRPSGNFYRPLWCGVATGSSTMYSVGSVLGSINPSTGYYDYYYVVHQWSGSSASLKGTFLIHSYQPSSRSTGIVIGVKNDLSAVCFFDGNNINGSNYVNLDLTDINNIVCSLTASNNVVYQEMAQSSSQSNYGSYTQGGDTVHTESFNVNFGFYGLGGLFIAESYMSVDFQLTKKTPFTGYDVTVTTGVRDEKLYLYDPNTKEKKLMENNVTNYEGSGYIAGELRAGQSAAGNFGVYGTLGTGYGYYPHGTKEVPLYMTSVGTDPYFDGDLISNVTIPASMIPVVDINKEITSFNGYPTPQAHCSFALHGQVWTGTTSSSGTIQGIIAKTHKNCHYHRLPSGDAAVFLYYSGVQMDKIINADGSEETFSSHIPSYVAGEPIYMIGVR